MKAARDRAAVLSDMASCGRHGTGEVQRSILALSGPRVQQPLGRSGRSPEHSPGRREAPGPLCGSGGLVAKRDAAQAAIIT
ncbi:hypothetical protein GCM10022241_04100 [Micrococcus endophyticus]